jgi:hypothetical protein
MLVLWAMGQGRRSALPSARLGIFLGVLVLAWALDGANSLAELVIGAPLLYEPRNSLRLATGMGSGLAIGAVLYPIYHFAMWRNADERRALDGEWQFAIPMLAGAACIVAMLSWASAPWLLWAALLSAAAFAVLALANATLIVLLLHKEGFASEWREVVPWLLAGFLVGSAEMGLLAFLRCLLAG